MIFHVLTKPPAPRPHYIAVQEKMTDKATQETQTESSLKETHKVKYGNVLQVAPGLAGFLAFILTNAPQCESFRNDAGQLVQVECGISNVEQASYFVFFFSFTFFLTATTLAFYGTHMLTMKSDSVYEDNTMRFRINMGMVELFCNLGLLMLGVGIVLFVWVTDLSTGVQIALTAFMSVVIILCVVFLILMLRAKEDKNKPAEKNGKHPKSGEQGEAEDKELGGGD